MQPLSDEIKQYTQDQTRQRQSADLGSTSDHRDLLKFVQEVARFVASRFLEKSHQVGVWKVAKSSDKVMD